MRLIRRRKLLSEPALKAERRELSRKFDNEDRIGKPPERLRALDAPGDEQKWQSRREPQQKAEEIGPPALGERSDVLTAGSGSAQ